MCHILHVGNITGCENGERKKKRERSGEQGAGGSVKKYVKKREKAGRNDSMRIYVLIKVVIRYTNTTNVEANSICITQYM